MRTGDSERNKTDTKITWTKKSTQTLQQPHTLCNGILLQDKFFCYRTRLLVLSISITCWWVDKVYFRSECYYVRAFFFFIWSGQWGYLWRNSIGYTRLMAQSLHCICWRNKCFSFACLHWKQLFLVPWSFVEFFVKWSVISNFTSIEIKVKNSNHMKTFFLPRYNFNYAYLLPFYKLFVSHRLVTTGKQISLSTITDTCTLS